MLAVADPLVSEPPNEATRILGQSVVPCLVRRHVLEQAVRAMAPVPDSVARLENEGVQVQAVQRIIAEAIEQKASDIHIEPMSDRLRIRFRQDGVLVQHADLPLESARALTSRIKVLAGADIAERRRHQDGRMLFEHEGANLDLRVSFYSTIHGEKIVLRLLNNRSKLLDINDIGMAPRMIQRFRDDVLDVPSGVVLVTGPTGSGQDHDPVPVPSTTSTASIPASSRPRIPSSTSSTASTSARSIPRSASPTKRPCATSCARIPTSSSSARSATGSRPTRRSRRPSRGTRC